VVNTITKSGGNKHAGLFEVQFTNSSLGSSNVTNAIRTDNPALADPAKETKLLDITGQISGPFIKDKLFYFGSVQRYQRETDPSGPLTYRKEVSPRLNGKLTYIKDAKNNFNLTLQADDYNIKGRCDVSAFLCADDLLDDEDAPEILWIASWRHVFSPNTLAEVKYTGWWGYFDLNPVVISPGRTDGEDGSRSVSLGSVSYYDRLRNQANASITHFADGYGKHELKFGVEVERSSARDRYGYVDDVFYYDYGGQPYLAYNYGYDIDGTNQRLAAFTQDSWQVNDRLTLNLGLRLDAYRGKGKEVGTVYSTNGITPRAGFAFDLTGDSKTVLKGSYGQYHEGLSTPVYAGALPGKEDFVLWYISACPSITANCAAFREEIDRSPATLYKIDPDIKHPRTDEFTLGFERALSNNLRLSVTGISRDLKNAQGSVIPSARWAPTTVTNTLTNQPLTVYRWTNRSASETDLLVTNPDGYQYKDDAGGVLATAAADRKYRAAMFVLNKRMSNNWQAQISYVWSRTEGHLSNGSIASLGTSRFFETPTLSAVNSDGRALNDRPHELKVLAGYQIPKVDVMMSAYYRNLSGRTYAPFAQLSASQLPGFPSSTWRRPLLAQRGSYSLPKENILDLRFEKVFKIGSGGDRLGVFADVTNVFNETVITGAQTRHPSSSVTTPSGESATVLFGGPSSINAPRQIQLTARWSF
jgi:outer membrane receptor protein involved in Fe transport